MEIKDIALLALPDLVDRNPLMYFPLALTYLASVISKAGYSVSILDCRDGIKELPEAKFYGFSCATPQIFEAKKIAKMVKGQTIIGGAHPSLLPNDCLHYFDYVVVGEGEEVILNILNGNIPKGIIRAPRVNNLDNIPYPAWDMVADPFSDTLFPGERYGKGEKAATLIGSRGCPFSCQFCGNVHKAPVRYRSADNIIGELKELIKRGVRHFRFEDDCFTLLPDYERLYNEIAKLNIHYKCHTRSDMLTDKIANLLKLSGCEECGLGVESADDKVLKIVQKRETAEDHLKACKILKNAGLRVKTYFIAGLPGETDETVSINKEFVKQTQVDKWTLSTFCPYPGCPIYNSPGKYGIEITNFDYSKWWNFSTHFNHVILGQTEKQMWDRYLDFYGWLKKEDWKQ